LALRIVRAQDFGEVPQSDIIVISSRESKGLTIGGKGHGVRPRRLAVETSPALARRHRPEAERSIIAGCGQE
jgi:hypothetical protein